ncbi:helix-turn-helix transcriptional regulator [Streptosporangiaceae bacterium NEAU-GS5]|nr:helix-turn-helix transcriptional regulator [Streptosporangiaceae bacterium NEAU-GS5]
MRSEPDPPTEAVARYARMLAALGAEPRLRIFRLLVAAHPGGLVVAQIMAETGLAASTLSHHLDKLKHDGLVTVERQGTYLRYRDNRPAVRELLHFFYAECYGGDAIAGAAEPATHRP